MIRKNDKRKEIKSWTTTRSKISLIADNPFVYKLFDKDDPLTGLTKEQCYENEKKALIELRGEPHFPYLLDYNDKNLSLTLKYCGVSLNEVYDPDLFDIDDFEKQMLKAFDVLQSKHIKHDDISVYNICYDKGVYYIIDFGHSTFNSTNMKDDFLNRIRKIFKRQYYKAIKFKNKKPLI